MYILNSFTKYNTKHMSGTKKIKIPSIIFYGLIMFSFFGGFLSLASWQKSENLTQQINAMPDDSRMFENILLGSTEVNDDTKVVEVVKRASPAVVSIIATADIPSFNPDPFSDIPAEYLPYFGFDDLTPSEAETIQIGSGTGFIVSEDGYIVTNRHVVQSEEAQYYVYLNTEDNTGERVPAQVVARDPNYDLAILKINRNSLPYLEFGEYTDVEVGQTAITIGYALGEFENSVSRGVISGLARSIVAGDTFSRTSEQLDNLIQTDAAINPGNSGGPMLNLESKVIGVNVAMAQAENIGFAIPSTYAQQAFSEVRQTGTIAKKESAFLGVRYLMINSQIKNRYNLPYEYGAYVRPGEDISQTAIIPSSPADRVGLRENDIILEVEGELVTERKPLSRIIANYSPDQEVALKIYTEGQEKQITVMLGELH